MKLHQVVNSIVIFILISNSSLLSQMDTTAYYLSIDHKTVNITGKEVKGMAINGQIPGPTLRFTEGDYAVIYVTNKLMMETSVHWHGLLLPNFYDGVPYLTTPPIEPGETQKYEFLIRQSGTYWYHSHTMLQEQSGVYGSIVIDPKEQKLKYDSDLVLVLSDWTNEKPMYVLKTLKRGTEWYNLRKGTATPLNRVIAQGGFGAQLNFWKQRMEGADIADIYYAAFLTNGSQTKEYPDLRPGSKVRVRFINAAASSSFWITFGGEDPILVSSDGIDVVPVMRNKTFIGVAETYDFIVTIPQSGKIEIRSTAQDGSGSTSAFLGEGQILSATEVPRPDKIAMMKKMAKMNMRMGAPALKFNPKEDNPYEMQKNWGMQMDKGMKMDHTKMDQGKVPDIPSMDMKKDTMKMDNMNQPEMKSDEKEGMKMKHEDNMEGMQMGVKKEEPMAGMAGMNMFSEYTYDYLKSPKNTTYAQDASVKEILLNLTGNMQRYIWSMNGIPLSETDNIKIKEGEVTRITFNNLTMMHHPMHLHGHFFRVLNEHGEYSPLKHTVNVPPMQKITIEFYGDEYGDWFFHCHILYHMMGGMARIFSYDTPRDQRLEGYPVANLVHETNSWYSWGMADVASHMTAVNLLSSNTRNQLNFSAEFGYNQNLEAEITYERYLYDYLRIFAGVNLENTTPDTLGQLTPTAVAGIRFLAPYLFNVDLRIDHQLRPRIGIGRSVMLFPRFSVFGYYEYQADFGFVNALEAGKSWENEIVWNAGAEFMLSKNFSFLGQYDNRFGGGGGLSLRF